MLCNTECCCDCRRQRQLIVAVRISMRHRVSLLMQGIDTFNKCALTPWFDGTSIRHKVSLIVVLV
jgi:hypothetical protein